MKRHLLPIGIIAASVATPAAATPHDDMAKAGIEAVEAVADSIYPTRYSRLTEDDYSVVAERLGVEVAAIKAIVDIETGHAHQGFASPGQPLINFDITMFRRFAQKRGINLSKFRNSHAVVFSAPNARRYGSRQNAQHARLEAARLISNEAAIEGTFWGMFQIGGFNWKKCGAASLDDFVDRMSRSELDQLELFAEFIENSGMTRYLRDKDWAGFALRYNGPSFRKRGYHTRLAKSYVKHKKDSSK